MNCAVISGNPSQYTGLVHAAVPEHAVVAGGSFGACGGGDALPTRPVQVHGWSVFVRVCVFLWVCVCFFSGEGMYCFYFIPALYMHFCALADLPSVWTPRQTKVKIDYTHPTFMSHACLQNLCPSCFACLFFSSSPCLGMPRFSCIINYWHILT